MQGALPEEGAQHLGDPGLVIGRRNEARRLDDVLGGVGHREGQVPLAHHGQVFDSSRRGAGTPPAFRVNELITGWQVALVNMHIGDVWELYVPATAGYGERGAGRDIPGHSTLIFRIELLDIA